MTARLSLPLKHALLSGVDLGVKAAFMSVCGALPAHPTNELAPRQPITWAAPAGGCRALTAPMTFTVPAASTVYSVGLWEFGGPPEPASAWAPYGSNAPARSFAAAHEPGGGPTVDRLASEAHGLQVGDTVALWAAIGAGLPENLAEDTVYYVVEVPDVDSFLLSESPGGPVLDIVGLGDGDFQRFEPAEFPSGGLCMVTGFEVCFPG
jgi:hypothetical protein